MNFPEVLIEIRPSKIVGGVGVFAVRDIKRGEKVIGQSGVDFNEAVPWSEFEKLDDKLKQMVLSFCFGTPAGFIAPENLDFNDLSVTCFLNHSCDGNVGFDEAGNFIAIKDIARDKELMYDYALAEANPNFRLACQCGAKNCRKVITGNDWQNGVADKKFMLPYLKKQLGQD